MEAKKRSNKLYFKYWEVFPQEVIFKSNFKDNSILANNGRWAFLAEGGTGTKVSLA